MSIPKKIIYICEDGKQEISITEAINYCGEAEVMEAMENGKKCVLKDKLEHNGAIQFVF
jgi:hypothetical protein